MIPYDIIQRGDPRDQALPKKWYAKAHTKQTESFRSMVQAIGKLSTVNSPDTMAVLESLIQLIPEFLANGRMVRLGDFGTFTVVLHSNGEEREEDVDEYSIKRAKVRFVPGKLFRNAISNFEFRKYNSNSID